MSDQPEDSKKRPAVQEDDAAEESATIKRARRNDDAASSGDVTVNYRWLDRGIVDVETGRNYHQAISLTVEGLSFDVHKGDVVRLNAEDAEGHGWMCKVSKLWDEGDAVNFRGAWLFSKDEINQYNGPWHGPLTKAALYKKMRAKERVLSDRSDDNEIGSILSVVTPVYRLPGMHVDVPPSSVLCRYRLETSSTRWTLFEYSGGDSVGRRDHDGTDEPTLTNDTLDDDEMSASSSGASSTLSDQVRIEGEGSNLRGDIQIGSKYQVNVPIYVPGAAFVTNRKPQLVWKANAMPDDALFSFLEKLATVLNEYLEKHGLTTLDGPIYTPLCLEKAEALMREKGVEKLCPSHMSSASSLTSKRNGLLKECDVDAVMQILHDNDYDVDKALDAVKNDLSKVTNGWTRTEKLIFNDGYRQEQGAIRNIAKLFQPMKNHKDVVDYWYRFKMSDQFRLYQEKKREQAMRMMECIEKRRFHEFTLSTSRVDVAENNGAKGSHWSETSAGDVASATEDRRRTARALLMDVKQTMDSNITGEIAAVLRELHEGYDAKLKKHLFSLLVGHPELQQRFLEFFPKV